MRIRIVGRGILVATLGLSALGFGTAHAQGDTTPPTIAFTTQQGATIVNLPQEFPPDTIETKIRGTATDDLSGVTVVTVDLRGPVHEGGLADQSCDAGNLNCTWSYSPPFISLPGEYTVTATAFDADGNSASTTTTIELL